MRVLRELAVLLLLLAVPGAVGVGVWLWLSTGRGAWANLGWAALAPLLVLVLLGGALGGRIRVRALGR